MTIEIINEIRSCNFKEKIDIVLFKSFLSNLEHCYLYGGSFTELIDKSYKMIEEIQKSA